MNLRHGLLFVAFIIAAAGCSDTQFIGVQPDPDPVRPVGDVCNVDAQCETGRCIGGTCVDSDCSNDDDCREDEICVLGNCEKADDFACQTDQRPLLTVSPTSLEFQQVAIGDDQTQVVEVGNIGDCLLTLQVISFSSNTNPDFACSPCSAEFFPQRIPPGRTLDVEVTYTPSRPGSAAGELLIRSDDVTAGDDGLFSVDLAADYDGIPALVVTPLELSFGYVPVNSSRTETIRITNQGTGAAALPIERLLMDNGQRFTIVGVRQGGETITAAAIDIDNPLFIPPFTEDNLMATVEVDVAFAPTTNADFTDKLIVRPGGISADQRAAVALSGSSRGPPQIEVNTAELEYGTIGSGALLLGTVDFKTVTIRNNGESDLVIEPRMGGGVAAADFTVSPSFLAPIPPAGAVVISIFYNPSIPSDPSNTFTPGRPIEAALNITSNDTDPTSDVLKSIPLKGWARSGVQDQVLVVEMEFDNADNSWAGSDFRNVDLAITNVDNQLTCTKPRFVSVGAGDQGVFDDGCDEWNEFTSLGGELGQSSWIGFDPFEEPERVVVRGLGPNGGNGQRFDINISYIEDCANIPSGLLSDILGIGSSVLLGLLGGAIGVPIAVPPAQISDTIANNCFDHAASTVTTRISLNGAVVASPSTRLGEKGDRATVAQFKRVNGAFCSNTAGVGGPDLQCQ